MLPTIRKMKISVIIPVYNTAQYVAQAVTSALEQPETAEVILVEDGSTDNSLAICKELSNKTDKVQLLMHDGGGNRGAAASRNLGLREAKFEFVAFLDADDYYLPDRFKIAGEVFSSNPECGGVYEATGVHVEDELADKRRITSGFMKGDLLTITEVIPPEELFKFLVLGSAGYFHLDGLVFKRSVVDLIGYMDEELKYHQDNDFMFKMAAKVKLLPGRLTTPVSMYRVHQNNRITSPRSTNRQYHDRVKMWRSTYRWIRKNDDKQKGSIVLHSLITYVFKSNLPSLKCDNPVLIELLRRFRLALLVFDIPEIIIASQYWRWFLPKKSG